MNEEISEKLFNALKNTNYIESSGFFVCDLIYLTVQNAKRKKITAKDIVENIEYSIFKGLGLSYLWKPTLIHFGIYSYIDIKNIIEILVDIGSMKLNSSTDLLYFEEAEKQNPLFRVLQEFEDTKLKDLLLKNKNG